MNPAVTIGIPVIPDREHYMDQCLQAILAQTYTEPYEILIVQHPGFHYRVKADRIPDAVSIRLLSAGKTLSNKRNAIIENAIGQYIINIDDDVVPEPDWLENLMHTAVECNYDIFWGLARPVYEKEFPEDLDPFEILIGGFHYDRKGVLRRKGLIGCNFGFKKGLRHKRGMFVESIGRGAAVQDGEEGLFVAECIHPRMGAANKAVVNHFVQANRINFQYIVKNQCSCVKARIFINRVTGAGNLAYLLDLLKVFIKALIPRQQFFRTIALEGSQLITALLFILQLTFTQKAPEDLGI
jgi:glycosyltransferase involved in cell wall biosynthesis